MAGSRSLSTDEEAAVLSALALFSARDRLYITLALNLGLRLRELTSLTVAQIWDGARPRAFLRIERRQLKLGRSTTRRRSVFSRTLPLNTTARTAIEEYFHEETISNRLVRPQELVFVSSSGRRAISRMQVSRILRRIFVAAGIDTSSRLGSHSLRKTFCGKIWEASGHNIEVTRASLRHRHISTTQAYLPCGDAEAHRLILALDQPAAIPTTARSTYSLQ